MTNKLHYYDIVGTVIPGVLLVAWAAVCFPALSDITSSVGLASTFGLLAGLALAVFAGQLVQALGSIIGPALYRSWGGRPSDKALSDGLGRYLPKDAAARVRQKLQAELGTETNPQYLFLHAMQLTDAANEGRAARFNGLYAYHRSQVVLVLIAIVMAIGSAAFGRLASWHWWHIAALFPGLLALLALAWHRARQRAIYYVREVLLAAEKIMDEREVETRQY
ncbi:hypothetical protein LCGC14_0965650 [marine sediment metagenome]|uniref:Uncharacterized protein n=1 Tax=marine sediment metagenome TaxID=412755 RepID=A0A0F9NZB4_9ZZZZ